MDKTDIYESSRESLRKQLFDIYGKPKSMTLDDFLPEADKIIDNMKIQSAEHDRIKEEYKKNHKLCPACGSEKYNVTLAAYVLKENYKDLNNCVCLGCGSKHTVHDRTPEIIF